MEEWRKKGSPPDKKPKLGDNLPSEQIEKDEETAERALEQWKKAMEEWRKNGSSPDKKPKIGDYWEPVKIEDEEDAVKRALEQWKKEMEEWRKNGSRPYEKPKMGDHLSTRRAEDEAMKAFEHVQRGKRFNCTGEEPWKKHGKRHCAEEGKWPCYRSCLKDTIGDGMKIGSGRCKKFCKKHGKPQVSSARPHATLYCSSLIYHKPGDCTSSSDDDFGCNLPILLKEMEAEKKLQNISLDPSTAPAADSTHRPDATGVPSRVPVDAESIISRFDSPFKTPEPSSV
jgi:hypothetical protein